IPISHGSAWLHRDLYETLLPFTPGDEATFEYGEGGGAAGSRSAHPTLTVRMEPDGTLTGRFTRTDGSVVRSSGPAIVDDEVDPYPPFITAVLVALAAGSKNPGLRIVGAEL
ncbi:MAG TPA: hypothetical protein VHC70_08115, partial [Phycisphaerales bacterium]|nr:hypothetical protein [Phycisphaerales bacterium]